MDGESSYESDISESWSLIDVNLNEESLSSAEAQILVNNSPSDENNVKLKNEEIELEKENQTKKLTDFGTGPLPQNEEACDSEEIEEIYRKSSDEENKTDCGDSDSIEILDIEGNYRETDIDRLDISFIGDQDDKIFPSDGDESFCKEKSDNENKNMCTAVIKRKKRKLSRHSDSSSIDSVNSDCSSSSGKFYSKIHAGEVVGDLSLQKFEFNGRPVYKHYKNNVANTVLSLSMGVIFAGVACIAIGHFLGVHDAGETAAELMESLKKLQMENIALQSRLSHLNRAFHTRDLNSKPNVVPNESLENNYCFRRPQRKSTETEIVFPPVSKVTRSSVEKFTKLQNIVKTKTNSFNNENGIDLLKLISNIHDQITYLNSNYIAKNAKLVESGNKISEVVQKIIDRLIYSQNSFEILQQLNDIVSKVVPDERYCEAKEKIFGRIKMEKIIPVTESDLLSVQWKPKEQIGESEKSVAVIYPQREEYYKVIESGNLFNKNQNQSINSEEAVVIDTGENDSFKPIDENVIFVEKIKESKPEFQRNKEKKKEHKKNDRIKKEKKKSEKKSKKVIRIKEESSTCSKKKDKVWEKRQKFLLKKSKQTYNETEKFQAKNGKVVKKALNDIKPKRSLIRKKSRKSKFKRVFVSSLLQKQMHTDKNLQKCHLTALGFGYQKQDGRCVNLTGNWVFKWADGRQQYRRHQALGDWQFDRAKGRRELRDEDITLNWQFKRALARENNRNDKSYRITSFNRNFFTNTVRGFKKYKFSGI